jgi:hypothetical protein
LKLPAARCAGSSDCISELLKTSGGESSICREEDFLYSLAYSAARCAGSSSYIYELLKTSRGECASGQIHFEL